MSITRCKLETTFKNSADNTACYHTLTPTTAQVLNVY